MAKNEKRDSSIAYQNKDIVSKVMAEQFKGKTFAVYGIDVPEIVEVKPTNLPAIEADELRLDNLFLLEDGSYAIVDYESGYSEENKVNYLKYLARVVERLYNEVGHFVPVKLIIIYTADVAKGSTNPVLDLGGVEIRITEAFLSGFSSEEIYDELEKKISGKEQLDDEDLMKLIIYPLTFQGIKEKQDAVTRAIDLAEKINDHKMMMFALKMIWTFSDKFITDKDAERIREVLAMTKVDRILAEEKRKAVEEAVDEAVEKTTEEVTEKVTGEVTKKVTEKVTKNIAKNMLKSGDSVEKVSNNTGLSTDVVTKLLNSIKKNSKRVAAL